MTDFCHIVPIKHLDKVSGRAHHLTLAHLVETRPEYTEFYVNEKKINPQNVNILDNSAFEMFKQGREMYPADRLIEMGKKINADYVVMTDHPGQPWEQTKVEAERLAPQFKEAGLGTFYVPQSKIGDVAGLIESFKYAATNPLIDYIGVSILAVPNAFGVERSNNLQRFLSRWHFSKLLADVEFDNPTSFGPERVNFWSYCSMVGKKIHFLGMVDGPNEIELMKQLGIQINTWDSSAATWAGINGIGFDSTPTGLLNGKFEKEVDFDSQLEWTELAQSNMEYINKLTESVNYGQ